MKSITLALIFSVASLTAVAQQPPAQSAAMQSLQQRYETANANQQLLFEKLHGITEFQQWMKGQQDMAEMQKEFQALSAQQQPKAPVKPIPAAKPAPKK